MPTSAVRLATWNVNSLRVRLPHVLDWLAETQVDCLGLQETKLVDAKFPTSEIESAGYHVVFAGQPTYNGVAILLRQDRYHPPQNIQMNNPLFADEQVRVIGATITPRSADIHDSEHALRFISVYVPNGSEVGSDKYAYKLRWLEAMADYLRGELARYPRLAVVGDYNIAPDDRDVHDPAAWHEQVLCSTPERQHFQSLVGLGLYDAFRLKAQEENLFSWWDYRQAAFRRNRGLRIDHLLVTDQLAKCCTDSGIDAGPRKKEQPSDHAPAWAEFAWP